MGESTNARITGKAALDTVIFGGNGVTGVVGILVDVLNLKGVVNAAANNENNGSNNNRPNNEDKRPVVFVGPHEHHSNLLPWRESGCEVISIPENSSGMVDLVHLEKLLQMPQYNAQSGRLRMGAFSAVSNVTGLIADVDQIAIILHRYGALAFFDYASGAPYVKMDMNPNPVKFRKVDGEMVDPSKDAIYFSPHKCYGGTSTPGVLVIKKHVSEYHINLVWFQKVSMDETPQLDKCFNILLTHIMCTYFFFTTVDIANKPTSNLWRRNSLLRDQYIPSLPLQSY